MHLLVAVLNAPEKLDSILAGFVELGVRGATVINSEGMGPSPLARHSDLRGAPNSDQSLRPENRTIFTVVSADLIDPIISLLQDLCGDLTGPQ